MMNRLVVRRCAAAALLLIAAVFLPACGALELQRPDLAREVAVGYREWEFKDPERGDRGVPVRLWYPAEKAAGDGGERAFYLLRDLGVASVGMRSAVAHRDLPPAAAGDFPVVLFSHGWGSGPLEAAPLAEILASRGFVVCSIGHAGNTYEDAIIPRGGSYVSPAADRPVDVRFTLDRLAAINRAPGPFRGAFDMQNVGMIGHSFGGYTAVAAAIGHGTAKETRLRAIMPVVPAYDEFTDDELKSLDVPFLQLGAAEDDICPVEKNLERLDDLHPQSPLPKLVLERSTHYHFSTAKEFGDALLAFGIPRGLWSAFGADRLDHAYGETVRPDVVTVDRAHRIEAFYALAFFSRYLRGKVDFDALFDVSCARALFPELEFSFDRPMRSE